VNVAHFGFFGQGLKDLDGYLYRKQGTYGASRTPAIAHAIGDRNS
jgi:hypothetical protein